MICLSRKTLLRLTTSFGYLVGMYQTFKSNYLIVNSASIPIDQNTNPNMQFQLISLDQQIIKYREINVYMFPNMIINTLVFCNLIFCLKKQIALHDKQVHISLTIIWLYIMAFLNIDLFINYNKFQNLN